MDPSDYAREIERYLCRKNDGHLIRIVGPAFEQVCGWAEQGVPLKVAFRGIDQYCERYYAKGARRRPVRVEFCEADILALFDAWRRAVGVGAAITPADPGEPAEAKPRKPPLAAHLERVVARLVNVRGRADGPAALLAALDEAVRELEAMVDAGRGARGDARARLVERLGEVDDALMQAALRAVDEATAARLRAEAAEELAPFGGRLTPEARAQALASGFSRLVRESLGLPVINYE
jgi:hypothetical protein